MPCRGFPLSLLEATGPALNEGAAPTMTPGPKQAKLATSSSQVSTVTCLALRVLKLLYNRQTVCRYCENVGLSSHCQALTASRLIHLSYCIQANWGRYPWIEASSSVFSVDSSQHAPRLSNNSASNLQTGFPQAAKAFHFVRREESRDNASRSSLQTWTTIRQIDLSPLC